MADEVADRQEAPRRPIAVRIAIWSAIATATLVVVAVLAVFALDTGPGRRFLVDRLSGYQTASGLKVDVGGL